ncbi:thiamine phosphate synthase [Flavobacterium cerinum]|uniref:Thiamine phosphate synthase n=1 Tax=Flavobacterium cerinum TaxID=2502784 RepID=A0A444GMC0_9FLAO|nr:thiamine phosphate synthase [Flavobacterium cerinum]RWW91881.1 thiamine phosphate synthase [Flavobacterium cerinum]
MIIITNPGAIANEVSIIHKLFDEGMELLHIRKPELSRLEFIQFVNSIDKEYYSKLVLHQYYEITDDYDITMLHITEKNRSAFYDDTNKLTEKAGMVFSTSIHSIEDFNRLSGIFEYAFLSPVYESISKQGYKAGHDILASVERRTNFTTRLIALGGITHENCIDTVKSGFDDVAVLGCIWNAKYPLEEFKKCFRAITNYV